MDRAAVEADIVSLVILVHVYTSSVKTQFQCLFSTNQKKLLKDIRVLLLCWSLECLALCLSAMSGIYKKLN